MKKTIYFIFSFVLLILINECTGYKPIFGSSNLQFKIADYSIEGDEKLGKQIYFKLYNLSRSNKNPDAKNISILIKVSKDKNATAKDSAGKILGYKLNLNAYVLVKDFLTDHEILNHNFVSSNFEFEIAD